jgi:VanZ family protein
MLAVINKYKFTLLTAAIVISVSLMGSSKVPSTNLWNFKGIDKLVHLAMYSGLSFVFFVEKTRYHTTLSKQPFNLTNIFPILALMVTGGIIELVQPALANRSREIMDFVANTTGVFIGFYLHIWMRQLLKR